MKYYRFCSNGRYNAGKTRLFPFNLNGLSTVIPINVKLVVNPAEKYVSSKKVFTIFSRKIVFHLRLEPHKSLGSRHYSIRNNRKKNHVLGICLKWMGQIIFHAKTWDEILPGRWLIRMPGRWAIVTPLIRDTVIPSNWWTIATVFGGRGPRNATFNSS